MGLLVRAQWNAGIRLHSARGEGVRLIQHSPIFVEEKYVVVVAAHHKNLPIQWKRNIVTVPECKHSAQGAVNNVLGFHLDGILTSGDFIPAGRSEAVPQDVQLHISLRRAIL